jgi:hypothetical protein
MVTKENSAKKYVEAAVKKAEELKDLGYFDIEITEESESKVA